MSIGIVLIAVLSTSCARSQRYADEQVGGGPEGSSYYQSAPVSGQPTAVSDRIQAMGQPKKRIVVMNFWNDTPVQAPTIGQFAGDELRRGLFLSKRVILPTEFKNELETRDFVEGDRVRVAQLVREGRRMSVAVLVVGRISRIVFRQKGDDVGLFRQRQSIASVDLEIKVFDTAGGREIGAFSRSGQAFTNAVVTTEVDAMADQQFRTELAQRAVQNAVAPLIPDIIQSVEKMTWEGQIARILGTKVYVNAGRSSGLVSGDILKVLTPGEEVYDPNTGAFLGRAEGQLKGTLEVVEFIGEDAAVSVVHTGGRFSEGDLVRLY